MGKLRNKVMLDHYKDHGFSTRTEMIDEALSFFAQLIKRRERLAWKKKALTSYCKSNPENYFEPLDGDEFE